MSELKNPTTKTMKLARDLAEDYIDQLEAKITGQGLRRLTKNLAAGCTRDTLL
jgi:hypothetical protein